MSRRPLIVHLMYRLDTGGMERVALSVMRETSAHYRHAVISLVDGGALVDEMDALAETRVCLHKRPGKDLRSFWRLWRTLRRLKPDLLQSYNFGTLDAALVARLAGVPRVVHAEHGRSVEDPHGTHPGYLRMRRWLRPFVDRFVAVSADLERWLRECVRVPPHKLACIPNGIDVERYRPDPRRRANRPLLGEWAPAATTVLVNVGRLTAVKNQSGLLDAFAGLRALCPERADTLKLLIVGEGTERPRLAARVRELGLDTCVLLAGNRRDVAELLPECDGFVLSSLAEGIPLTVLEAMACGLPVVATRVGGVGEVVCHGQTGTLVPAQDVHALAAALAALVRDAGAACAQGQAGRRRVLEAFSHASMANAYDKLYGGLLAGRRPRVGTSAIAMHGGSGES